MHSVVITNDAESSDRKGLAYLHARQREIGIAARGATALSTTAERDDAFAAFLRHDVLQIDVYQRWGVTFATTLHRGGAKGFTLHMDSDSPDFPNERHDLSQGEVDAWCAERDAEPAPRRPARDVYSPKQLADRWAVSTDSVRRAIRRDELEAFRTPGGKLLRVRAEAVQAYELSRRPEVATAETTAQAAAQRKATDSVLSGHRARLSARSAHQRRAAKATDGEGSDS